MARAVTYALLLLASQSMLRSSAQSCVETDIIINITTVNLFADEVTNATLTCAYSGDLVRLHHEFGGKLIDILDPGDDDDIRNYKYMLERFPNYVLQFQPVVKQRHQGWYFCSAPTCNRMSKKVFIDVQGVPYLEYRVSLGLQIPPMHMTVEENATKTLNISFNTFASPRATVALQRQQADGGYQPYSGSRITTTDSHVTFSNLLPIDQASYLITAVNTFGPSINNLTFDLTVQGKGEESTILGTVNTDSVIVNTPMVTSTTDSKSATGNATQLPTELTVVQHVVLPLLITSAGFFMIIIMAMAIIIIALIKTRRKAAPSFQAVVTNYQGGQTFSENVAYSTVSHRLRTPSPAKLNCSDNAAYSATGECNKDSSEQTAVYAELNRD